MHRTLGRVTLAAFVVTLLAAPGLAVAQDGPYQFHAVTPCRAFDSRVDTDGATPLARGLHHFRLKGPQGTCDIPETAKALTINATIVSPNSSGWLTIWPTDKPEPLVSTLNFLANEPGLANGAIIPVEAAAPGSGPCNPITETGTTPGANCDISARIALHLQGSGFNSHLIFDITGYFE